MEVEGLKCIKWTQNFLNSNILIITQAHALIPCSSTCDIPLDLHSLLKIHLFLSFVCSTTVPLTHANLMWDAYFAETTRACVMCMCLSLRHENRNHLETQRKKNEGRVNSMLGSKCSHCSVQTAAMLIRRHHQTPWKQNTEPPNMHNIYILPFKLRRRRHPHHHQWQQWPATSRHCMKSLWIKRNVYIAHLTRVRMCELACDTTPLLAASPCLLNRDSWRAKCCCCFPKSPNADNFVKS